MNRSTMLYRLATEQQGHVVIAVLPPMSLPAVGDRLDYSIDDVEGPFVVCGSSCAQDFIEQTRKFNNEELMTASCRAAEAIGFFKVIAE